MRPVEIGAGGFTIKGFEQVSEVSDQWHALADRLEQCGMAALIW